MLFEFKFLNRDDELYQLQQDFITEVIQQKKCSSYLISGRRGAGKSRLIHEFLNSLEADQRIAVNIPKFRRNVHAIEYAFREDGAEPYRPFMEIKDQIERQQKGFRILRYAGMLLISFLPIHDVVDDLQKLVGEMGRGMTDEVIRSKETATFAKYLRMLKRRSKHIPIVLYIQNIQWIDDHSLKLLQTLIENEKSLWGMIILEENETPASNEKTTTIFRRLIEAQKMKRLTLKPMHKGFEIQLLEDRFRPRLFTNNELEHIYTLSEGCPGLLADFTNDWVRKGWIYQENSEWEKIPEFEHKIKVPYQKMLDLLITLLQDGMISPREQLLIDNFAQEWDIDKATVASMIDMIMKAREIGYDIVMRTHRGTLGEDAFLAHDKDMNKFIVEYVTNVAADEKEIVPREVKHPALLASRDIKKCDDGVLIVNDFFEGKTLREVNEEAHESHVMKVLKIAVQVAEGLEELHRNGLIHGYLRPESIIVTADGEIRLSALDASQLKLSETMDTEKYLGIVAYFSPEQVKGEKQGVQSDIFSFGVLLYELLTGEHPFTGANRGELKESICYKNHPDLTAIQPPIPFEVQKILEKCLQKNPDDRYQSTKILLDDLKRLIIESKIITSEAESPDSHLAVERVKRTAPSASRRKKILIPAFAILLIACAAIYYQFFFKKSSWGFAAKTIVVEPFNVVNESDQNIGALPEMIKYLIIDDLLQSSRENVHVFSQKDFELAHDVKEEKPELIVSGTLTVKDFDYELRVILSRPGEKKDVLPFSFGDPSALLKTIITEITRSILIKIGKPAQRKFMNFLDFTDRWGAFEQFYEGEQAWEKLDLTRAQEKFKSALVQDRDFVLAKVRSAQVFLYGGDRLEAQRLIHEVQPHLPALSRLDSMRVEALSARLTGDIFGEISILQDIYNSFPTRKEFAYNVAEALYEICDIDKAKYYYEKALQLDKNFARAHNHLAYCYSHQGQHDQALYHFRKYVELDSTANAFDSMGDGFMAAGKLDSAAWAKQQGIRIDPDLSYLWGSLGYVNIRQGKLELAERNINRYINLASGNDRKARGIVRKSLVDFYRKDYQAALDHCLGAKALYDTTDLVLRDHDLHWLLGLLYLQLDQPDSAQQEIDQMEKIVAQHSIDETNYRMGIYKYWLALKACLAAYQCHLDEFLNLMKKFDGPIKDRIKDHSSPFDLSYLNTIFGEFLMMEGINRPDLAEARLKLALNYNPNYALAHYDLWQLYLKTGEEQKSMDHQNKFKLLWEQADEDVKGIYGF